MKHHEPTTDGLYHCAVQARANSLKQPRENRKGGNDIVQVDKYNTWASEGRRQAASHHALDKFVDLSTRAYCNHPRERMDDHQQKCNNRFCMGK